MADSKSESQIRCVSGWSEYDPRNYNGLLDRRHGQRMISAGRYLEALARSWCLSWS